MRPFLIIIMLLAAQMSWAETETQTIARVIAAEACGEGELGMELVAMTILNRATLRHTTPYKEATRPNQYYGLTAINSHKLYAQCKDSADRVASRLMNGYLKDEIDGAIYFRRPDEPMFRWCKIKTFRYLNHIFYR